MKQSLLVAALLAVALSLTACVPEDHQAAVDEATSGGGGGGSSALTTVAAAAAGSYIGNKLAQPKTQAPVQHITVIKQKNVVVNKAPSFRRSFSFGRRR